MSEIITLDRDSPSIQHLCSKCKRMKKIISMIGPITYSPHDGNEFCFIVHEIIEQMLSIKAGQKIYNRLKGLCEGNITPDSVMNLSEEDIRSTGTSKAKAIYIRGLAEAVQSGNLVLEELSPLPDEEVRKKLTALHGIGDWTAKMYLIFVLDRQDILPYEDGAFLQAYRWAYKTEDLSVGSIKKKCKKWSPYSSIAARYLYRALDSGLTKKEFHLYK